MVTEIIYVVLASATCPTIILIAFFVAWILMNKDLKKEDKRRTDEWNAERSKLLDRIQSSGLAEFKAQERADTPIKRIVKDPLIAKLESEPWL